MNARRALKALETLARARDMELAELRRAAALAVDRLEKTEAAIARIEADMMDEAVQAGGDPELLGAYARFAAAARVRSRELTAAREARAAECEQADAQVLEAFRALKQIEAAAKARRDEIADEEARKERADADDLAAIKAYDRAS